MGLGLIMCRNAIIHHPDGTETVCTTQGELLAAMPNGIWFPPSPRIWFLTTVVIGYDASSCLCPVDLPRTAKENGYRVSRLRPDGTEDYFDDHLYDPTGREPTTLVVG